MRKYNKIEVLKLTVFWMLAIGIICFIVTSILAVSSVTYNAILGLFIVGTILIVPSGIIWIALWFSKINKKIIGDKKEIKN
ncbi:hypothetical protein [Mycoplasmoides pirum]|uniref:hypothetical protein n=1 Tax=Mycoplasmoides pirum TaxID=2122 RepID=UPI0004897BF5|nr:hypothetical protein [Mycoplasmoides pirum]